MTYQLNEKLKKIDPYKVAMEDCRIRLDANESFILPEEELKHRLMAALGDVPLNRYPDDSYGELRKAYGGYCNVDPDLIVAGSGSDELISLLIGAFLKSDDKLLLANPDFSMYPVFASTYERHTCFIARDSEGNLNTAEVIDKIRKEKVTALLFSNPSSAFSTVMEAEKVMEIVDNTDALVIVDEAYMDFSDQSVLQEAASRDNLIVLRTCSKALGCAGIRLGFAHSSSRLINVINALRPPYNLNILTETAGRVLLSEPGYIEGAIAKILENRAELYEGLKSLEAAPAIKRIYPTATNYICIETDHAERIREGLKARSILVRSLGTILRVTVGTGEENRQVIEGIKAVLSEIEGMDK